MISTLGHCWGLVTRGWSVAASCRGCCCTALPSRSCSSRCGLTTTAAVSCAPPASSAPRAAGPCAVGESPRVCRTPPRPAAVRSARRAAAAGRTLPLVSTLAPRPPRGLTPPQPRSRPLPGLQGGEAAEVRRVRGVRGSCGGVRGAEPSSLAPPPAPYLARCAATPPSQLIGALSQQNMHTFYSFTDTPLGTF